MPPAHDRQSAARFLPTAEPAVRRPPSPVLGTLAALVSVAACALLFWRINAFPAVGYDEWWFLARAERLVAYGDPSDIAGFDLFAGNGQQSKLPPLGFPMRSAIHLAFQRGVALARPISAVEMIVLGTLLGALARRIGAPVALVLLGPAFLLTSPTVFLFARTVRYEQDTFFFGALSLLVPSLWAHRRAAWVASGLLAGAAASMHPMGSLFPAAILMAAVLEWRRGGAPAVRAPLVAWMAALAVPIVITTTYYLWDWTNSVAHFHGTRLFHEIHHPQRTRALRALLPLPAWVPDQPGAVVNAVWYGMAPLAPAAGVAGRAAQALWGMLLVAVTVGAAAMVVRRFRWRSGDPGRPWVAGLWASAVVAAAVVTFGYPANNDYVLYWSGLGGMASFLAAARLAPVAPPARAAWAGAVIAALAALDLFSAHRAVAGRPPDRASSATEVAALREAGRRLGIGSGQVTYADTISWAAAGERLAPVQEYAILEVAPLRSAFDGIVVSADWYGAFVTAIAPYSGDPIDPARRLRRMEALVRPLSFAGCAWTLDAQGTVTETRLFLLRKPPARPLFTVISASGPPRFLAGDPVTASSFPVSGRFSDRRTLTLPAGRYAAMLSGATVSDSHLAARVGGAAFVGSDLRHFPHAAGGSVVGFSTPGGDVVLTADGMATGTGDATAHVWRLTSAP